jgi:hypothetical protein
MSQFESTEDPDIGGTSEPALSTDEVSSARAEEGARDLVGGEADDVNVSVDGTYDDDDAADPAFAAVIEAGGGVAEGFEQSEAALVENATDSEGSTADILFDAIDEEGDGTDKDVYGEGDDVLESSDDD